MSRFWVPIHSHSRSLVKCGWLLKFHNLILSPMVILLNRKICKSWMIIWTMSRWYSFERALRELSNEYQCDKVPMIIQLFTDFSWLIITIGDEGVKLPWVIAYVMGRKVRGAINLGAIQIAKGKIICKNTHLQELKISSFCV